MNTYTPAPWYALADGVADAAIGYRAIIDSDGYTVCNPSPMGEANARLIAAAPTLLEALRVIAESEEYHGDTVICDFETLQNVARAAIAKATGETL